MRRVASVALATVLLTLFAGASFARSPRLTPSEQRKLARIETTTQQIRGLKALHTVRAVFPSDNAFDADVNREMRRLTPESDVQTAQREYVLLGLLARGANLHKILFQNATSQVIGLYDRHQRVLYVRNRGNVALGIERWSVAHEFTHALQDQHFNLRRLMPDNPGTYRNTDATGAHHALTEGDAVLTQLLYRQATYTGREIRDLSNYESRMPAQPLPRAINRQFEFPYTTGVTFVEDLYYRGGMKAVDAAYRRLPSSTYEIMHPNAYLAGWRPVPVALHRVQGFSGWKRTDDDVFGAEGYQILLWQFLPAKTANQVTNAYRGDRYAFFRRGSQDAMLFKSVWATPGAARAAEQALRAALAVRFKSLALRSKSPLLVSYHGGAVYMATKASRLTMAYAPSPSLARKLGREPTS